MKKITTKKKGFTIVELVIVIAVIGILSAILIPTFINLNNKARVANTTSFLKSINTQIAMKEANEGIDDRTVGGFETMSSGIEYAKKRGFDLEEISPFEGNEIVWDEANHRFAFVNGEEIVYSEAGFELKNAQYMPDDLDDFATKVAQHKKVYAKAKLNFENGDLTVDESFDAGTNTTINSVKYVSSDETKEVIIRTNRKTLFVGAEGAGNEAKGKITHYGAVDNAVVYTTKNSFHTRGAVGKMELKAGKAVAETGGIIYLAEAKAPELEVIENGGQVVIPAGTSTVDVLPAVAETIGYTVEAEAANYDNAVVDNKVYEIGNLPALENFRDLVNGGFNFKALKVKLTADITLDDGWTPIGEGSRDVDSTSYVGSYLNDDAEVGRAFEGEFDGGNHTISNLNNKGYEPSIFGIDERKVGSVNKTYEVFVYGFFGIAHNATIKNITFKNVSIDYSNAIDKPTSDTDLKEARADSVAALVGYAAGNLNVSGVKVTNGNIIADDAASGIVGRINVGSNQINISGCTNGANITATRQVATGIARAYKFSEGGKLTLVNNTNTGSITGVGSLYGGIAHVITKTDAEPEQVTAIEQSGNINNNVAAELVRISSTYYRID